jgi:hypothetical protein
VTHRILELTGADPSLIRHVEDRAGHDRRYALDDGSCARSAGRPGTPSARAGCPRRSSGTRRTAPGGSRSSPASTAATTRSSTPSGSGPEPPGPIHSSCASSHSLRCSSWGSRVQRPTAPKRPRLFRPRRRGWGTAVGMSQWGAYGQAKAGATTGILATYYRGTRMGSAPDTLLEAVRVLVGDSLANGRWERRACSTARESVRSPRPITAARPELPVGRTASRLPGPRDDPRAKGAFLSYAARSSAATCGWRRSAAASSSSNVVGLEEYLSASSRARCRRTGRSRRSRRRRSRADVRSRPHRPRAPVRPLLGLAQPGLLRRRLGGARTTRAVRETAGRSSTYDGAPAQTSTSPRAAAGRSARSTPSASTSRTSSRSTIRGTRLTEPRRGAAAPHRRASSRPLRPEGPGRRRRVRPGHAREAGGVRLTTADGGEHRRGCSDVRHASASSRRASVSATCGSTRRPSRRGSSSVQLTGVARQVERATLERRSRRDVGDGKRLSPARTGRSRSSSASSGRPSTGSPPTASPARR